MLDKIKQLSQLKKLQDEFKQERLTVKKRGVKVTINGNFEVEDIALNPELSVQDQQDALRQALNEARENIQKTLAQKMMSSGISF